jgi:hypothetical protein
MLSSTECRSSRRFANLPDGRLASLLLAIQPDVPQLDKIGQNRTKLWPCWRRRTAACHEAVDGRTVDPAVSISSQSAEPSTRWCIGTLSQNLRILRILSRQAKAENLAYPDAGFAHSGSFRSESPTCDVACCSHRASTFGRWIESSGTGMRGRTSDTLLGSGKSRRSATRFARCRDSGTCDRSLRSSRRRSFSSRCP